MVPLVRSLNRDKIYLKIKTIIFIIFLRRRKKERKKERQKESKKERTTNKII